MHIVSVSSTITNRDCMPAMIAGWSSSFPSMRASDPASGGYLHNRTGEEDWGLALGARSWL